ncbi:glycosyltransferase [Hyphomonas sp.]|uniref:glycosyltransferase n=1 Tax=Hyphomonas sp. TaxID=87 RepID=UPI0025BE17D8|nr:glycosyltransferase [Hyphomonas sp.]
MRVKHDWSHDASWGVVPYVQESLAALSDEESNHILLNGAAWLYDRNLREKYKDYDRRCLLAFWSPCEFTSKTNFYHFDDYDFFTEVYCVCPFTCKFMNEHYGYEKFKYIPYMFTNRSVTEYGQYDADCSWMGSIHGRDHVRAIEVMSKFKYKFMTSQKNTWMHHPYEYQKCTHVMLPNDLKLQELSKCRSSLSFNMIYMSPASRKNNFDAFERFDEGIMPQFKVRTFEIASCKSLLLVKKDPWNLVEDFFEPGKDFIYFENFNELQAIIEDVSKNFESYQGVIESAFNRVQDYTVEKIYEYIKQNDNNLITWRNKHV